LFALVTTVGFYSFRNCKNLRADNLDLYNATIVGNYAFYNCKGINTVTIGENVNTIGTYAFANCSALEEVIWHTDKSSVTIGTSAFPAGCVYNYR